MRLNLRNIVARRALRIMATVENELRVVGNCETSDLVCYCFRVTEAKVRQAIETFGAGSVDDVREKTCAGAGCTACHCRIRRMLAGLPAQCGPLEICGECGFGDAECVCQVA